MVFKICEGILCSSFSVTELDVTVHNNHFPCKTLLIFWPICIPHHQWTWWLRWELGIVTRSYYWSIFDLSMSNQLSTLWQPKHLGGNPLLISNYPQHNCSKKLKWVFFVCFFVSIRLVICLQVDITLHYPGATRGRSQYKDVVLPV